MAKSYDQLRAKMSLPAQHQAEENIKQLLDEIALNELQVIQQLPE